MRVFASGALLAALFTTGFSLPSHAAGDAAKGEQVFKKCMACHRVGDGARNMVGPVLNGVIGRQAGTSDGFSYSALNKAAGENGLTWTEEQIFAYLVDPNVFLRKYLTDKGKADLAKGSTKMTFKLANETERQDVVAYLKTFSPPK